MGSSRNWTAKEYEYLQENWGRISLPTLCKKLNRTENAVLIKVSRLGLGAFLDNGEYITLNVLFKALGCKCVSGYMMTSWVEQRGFPLKHKKVNKNTFKVVSISDFWKWAENNRHFFDFTKLEKNALGKEPSWVDEQRKIDNAKNYNFLHSPWTKAEDERLIFLLKRHKYGYAELSEDLKRSCGAIQRRINDLGLKERPVKADNHIKWTSEQLQKVIQNIINGVSYDAMQAEIGKSAKAIQGKIYVLYGTESPDKVREILIKREDK